MQEQEKSDIGFWTSFGMVLVGLLVAMVVGGTAWGTAWGVKVFGLAFALAMGAGYFVWRGHHARASLLRTGLEWVYGLALLALFGAWILSADPRQGLSRVGALLGYLLLFYIVTDALENGLCRRAVLAALLTASGAIIFVAVLETYAAYSQWWVQTGSRQVLPPYPYRFISLVGHSNALMGLANLFAPLALVMFLQTKKMSERILLGFWLVAFVFVIPFSSSRGGWLGSAAGMGLLLLYGIWKKGPRAGWCKLPWGGKVLAVLLGAGLLTAAGLAAGWGYAKFAAHPSHGTNLLGGRSEIWTNALQVWLANPFFGAGPGRFGFGYLQASSRTPPGFWALHAHSLPIQVLAEFGSIGGIAFLGLIVGSLRWFWTRWRQLAEAQRMGGFAILAGCAAWGVQMIVDEQTGVGVVITSLILLVACFVSMPEIPLGRWPQINFKILLLPCLMLAVGAGWGLWAYAPLSRGIQELRQGNVQRAAPSFSQSMARDPNYSFYATQAGFAWAEAAAVSKDERELITARRAFARSLAIEPDVSLLWANMAVVDDQTRRYAGKAIADLQQAITLSPQEASYYLNLGWMYEKRAMPEQAGAAYGKALEIKPAWAEHPFWQLTAIRRMAFANWQAGHVPGQAGRVETWAEAREAILDGELRTAELLLIRAGWMGESALAIKVSQGMLAEARGEQKQAMAAYEDVAEMVQQPVLHGPHQFMLTYTVWMNHRQGITQDVVPGYMQLEEDVGQFTALEWLYGTYREQRACEQAGRIWHIWQNTVHGGAVEVFAPEPACP